MLNWIKGLFSNMDRSQHASGRIADSLERTADYFEMLERTLKERGGEIPALPAPEQPRVEAIAHSPKNGRKVRS